MSVQNGITQYAAQLLLQVQGAYHFLPADERPLVEVENGRKYAKVIVVYGGARRDQRMCHSFVDLQTGDVYKPGGWAKPAKGVRFNLVSNLTGLLQSVDPYGSYLYMR